MLIAQKSIGNCQPMNVSAKTTSKHPGRKCLRLLLDSFEIKGHGKHNCLVHQPLGMSVYDLKMHARAKVFNKEVLRTSIKQVLAALDYLHKEVHVMYTVSN